MKKILYIDYGSKGHSGFYSNLLITELEKKTDCISLMHVNYTYKNKKNIKILGAPDLLPNFHIFIRLMKLVELPIMLFMASIIAIYTKIKYKNVVIIVNIYQRLIFYKFFSRITKLFANTYFIIHDAIPHKNSIPHWLLFEDKEITECITGVVCFGKESFDILSETFSIIYRIEFPCFTSNIEHDHQDLTKYILSIGVIREEKNIDILIDQWEVFISNNPQSELSLVIAGQNECGIELRAVDKIKYQTHYLNDDQFNNLIRNAFFVVLPYSGVTNSGVLATSLSYGIPCITSTDPIFINSNFKNTFIKFDDFKDLNLLFEYVDTLDSHNYLELKNKIKNKLSNQNIIFNNSIQYLIREIL